MWESVAAGCRGSGLFSGLLVMVGTKFTFLACSYFLTLATPQVFKGFDWLERLVFFGNELLVVGFHSVSSVVCVGVGVGVGVCLCVCVYVCLCTRVCGLSHVSHRPTWLYTTLQQAGLFCEQHAEEPTGPGTLPSAARQGAPCV